MRRRRHRPVAVMAALVVAVTAAIGSAQAAHSSTATALPVAGGGPGATSYFDLARKDCLGTAENTASKVWYTVANGVLSDVYEPTVDNTNVGTLQYVVTDGSTFTDLQTRDMTYTAAADPTGMACTVTATSAKHGYRLITTYVTDPAQDSVLMDTRLTAVPGARTNLSGLHVYARLDAHVNGNGGGGSSNGGADSGVVDSSSGAPVPVVYDTSTTSQATNRDYAVPTFMALRTSSPAGATSVGFAGTAGDGLTQLDATRTLGTRYGSASNGHIIATTDVTPGPSKDVTLALGFGRTQQQAVTTAGQSLSRPFAAVAAAYLAGWLGYDIGLKSPHAQTVSTLTAYYLSANVLKASEDKTYPGAIVASLASPWGQAVSAGATPGGQPVYFGSYREVFARDLYEAFTGLLADGDLATARDAARFLFDRQQLAGGAMPRNSLVNGKAAPDTGGDQLDETAYPILMAYQAGLGSDATLWAQHIRPAADFLVAHGPSFGVERWEEQSGYSPSTIAAEIAGLTAAAVIATGQGDADRAQVYQAAADDFQRSIKGWTVTTTGPDGARYFIRLAKTGDPNAAITYNLGNGGPSVDQRSVVDGGFQELVRLGELPANDPDVQASLAVLDKQISTTTPSGPSYYRYGTSAAQGSADGYGDCFQPSQTSCTLPGQPWPTTNVGTGHPWPVLSGERGESALAAGDSAGAATMLQTMIKSSSGVGLVPEQAWEDPNLAASPYGTDPTVASIGFVDGKAAGSASPLTWAQAQELRLIADIGSGGVVDRPTVTTARYVDHPAPGVAPVTLTGPTAGTTVDNATVPVTGTTVPGARVVVEATDTDTGAPAATVVTAAAADGSFSVVAPVGFGTNVLSVSAAAADGRTGYSQVAVIGDVTGGTTVLDQADPTGDDHGPGTYQYPTASAFQPGSFDLTDFQVITAGPTVYLRTKLADLSPTFGNLMGAQLLDVYVHTPNATVTSMAASYPSRDYSIAPQDAWSQRIEIQGFAAPVWVNPNGSGVGTAAVVASQTAGTITIAVPAAQFGTPGPGWSFSVVLTGQDGYSQDQARSFASTPQPYQFGVCPAGGTAPICSVDPSTVPKAVDVLTPPGVSQATELDPTLGPVVIRGVPVS